MRDSRPCSRSARRSDARLVDYERRAPPDVDRENIVVLGGGVSLPLAQRTRGNWRVALASLRFGWVETFADAGSSGAFRFAVEVTPAWLS